MRRQKLLKSIWFVVIILLLGLLGGNFKVDSQRKTRGFGVARKGDQVYYYGLTGELEKTVDLKKRIVTYQNKTRQFFESYHINRDPFDLIWTVKNDRFLNALPDQREVYSGEIDMREDYFYKFCSLKVLYKIFLSLL